VLLVACAQSAYATLYGAGFYHPIYDGPQDTYGVEAPIWEWGTDSDLYRAHHGSPGDPYERDILIDFAAGSGTDPTDLTIVYGGYLDDSLKSSDYWNFCDANGDPSGPGDLQYWDTFGGVSSVVGVDARLTGLKAGYMHLHLDNIPGLNPFKDIWAEMEYTLFRTNNDQASVSLVDLVPPGAYNVVWEDLGSDNLGPSDGGGSWYRAHIYWNIRPNPSAEDFVVGVSAMHGYYAGIDHIHILTECVPEPASMALLGLAGSAMGLALKKRRKA
jgi:hypothetical protein